MTVKELRELLETYDEETEVYFGFNYPDHWKTAVALPVEDSEELHVIPSDYHGRPFVKVVEDEGDTENHKEVLVLQYQLRWG